MLSGFEVAESPYDTPPALQRKKAKDVPIRTIDTILRKKSFLLNSPLHVRSIRQFSEVEFVRPEWAGFFVFINFMGWIACLRRSSQLFPSPFFHYFRTRFGRNLLGGNSVLILHEKGKAKMP